MIATLKYNLLQDPTLYTKIVNYNNDVPVTEAINNIPTPDNMKQKRLYIQERKYGDRRSHINTHMYISIFIHTLC